MFGVVRYIKDLLGYFNRKTTKRYLHVSKKSLVNIISPLDDLFYKWSSDRQFNFVNTQMMSGTQFLQTR